MKLLNNKSRLSTLFGLRYPIVSAPMAFAAGGRLAAAVTKAGGLGLIGGGYGDQDWIDIQFDCAANENVGCGFITWHLDKALQQSPQLLDSILCRQPAALLLSFGDPKPYATKIIDAKIPLICQIQTVEDCKRAIDCGAQVIVAQGSEAGGHGLSRATMTLVPEVADLLSCKAPGVILCAAGGIADGRGLAASLMLGADGVMVGSRFWASQEADVHPHMIQAVLDATGDDTIRSTVMDIARHFNWPSGYTARVLKNAFTERWHNDIEGLLEQADVQAELWKNAWIAGDVETANTFIGEAAGLISEVPSANDIIGSMVAEAESCIKKIYC